MALLNENVEKARQAAESIKAHKNYPILLDESSQCGEEPKRQHAKRATE